MVTTLLTLLITLLSNNGSWSWCFKLGWLILLHTAHELASWRLCRDIIIFFLTSPLDLLLNFYFYINQFHHLHPNPLLERLSAIVMTFLLKFNSLTSKLKPSLESDLVVHFSQEGIEATRLLYHFFIDVFRLWSLLKRLFDCLIRQLLLYFLWNQENIILRPQLENLHLPVQFHASEFLTHTSVQQFVEENIAIVTLNTHL
jgi:hypothetical protein